MPFEDEGFTNSRIRFYLESQQYCHYGIDPQIAFSYIDDATGAMCGSIDLPSDRVQQGPVSGRFSVTLKPVPGDMAELLSFMGFNGTDFANTEFLSEVTCTLDYRSRTYVISNCKCDGWQLRGQKGGTFFLQLDIVGIVTNDDGSIPGSPQNPRTGKPFAFHNATATIAATARDFDRVVIAQSHSLVERLQNSLTPDKIIEGDRQARFGFSVPKITGNNDLITKAINGASDTAGTFTVTSPSGSDTATLTLNLRAMFAPFQLPDVQGRTAEVRAPHFYKVRKNASDEGPIDVTYVVA